MAGLTFNKKMQGQLCARKFSCFCIFFFKCFNRTNIASFQTTRRKKQNNYLHLTSFNIQPGIPIYLHLFSTAGEKVVFEAVASNGAGVTATWLKDNAQLDDKLADRLKVEIYLEHGGKPQRASHPEFTCPVSLLLQSLGHSGPLSNLLNTGDTERQPVQPGALQLHNR